MGPPYNLPVLASQDYYEPASVGEAIDLLHRGGGNYKLIAGGTDVIINLRRHTERCRALINIKKMPDIATWSADAGKGLHIGAATPFQELERSTTVIQQYPALLESMVVIGSLQLRNQATIGGNLCNASPAADSAPSLMVYGAMVTYVDDGQGERTLPVEQFFAGPGRSVLGPTGVLLRVDVPEPTKDTGACYLRFTPRSAMDIAIASVASPSYPGTLKRANPGCSHSVGSCGADSGPGPKRRGCFKGPRAHSGNALKCSGARQGRLQSDKRSSRLSILPEFVDRGAGAEDTGECCATRP